MVAPTRRVTSARAGSAPAWRRNKGQDMASGLHLRLTLVLAGAVALSGCADGKLPSFMRAKDKAAAEATSADTTTRTVEREVEAPEVFQVTDKGLWDGRPSLGGVWVAHPDVTDPQRVIIRNETNGKFVIGVVYRPERQAPGPKFQVSSDAADELGMLAGQPAELNVTALKREEVPVEEPKPETKMADAGAAATAEPAADAATAKAAATPKVDAAALDPIKAAAAALDAAEGKPAAAPAKPAPKPISSSGLSRPFIQIGIFSVKKNADNTSQSLRQAGMLPTIRQGKMNDKAFWRVIVGPATSAAERATLLKKIKALGFTDAYYVTN